MTGVKKNFLKLTLDKSHFITEIKKVLPRENGGTALGLSMVRWIVNLHNGTIHVESIEDIGTSFIFRFPKI